MTDPKDTTIEVLCAQVDSRRKDLAAQCEFIEATRISYNEKDRELAAYMSENEKLRAMIAEFRRRIGLADVYSPALQAAPVEVVLATLDDCEREAFGTGEAADCTVPVDGG